MKKRILVAPLNWGIGHATRCIPIIQWLIDFNFEPIIASDGDALALLKKEFPKLIFETLPSYNIAYSKKGSLLKWKLFTQTPKILKTKKAEKKATKALVEKHNISGIISDNRFGVKHHSIPSVFITHQLQVLSGNTSAISTKIHQNIMKQFDAIWIPDVKNEPNLSGKLGHLNNNEALHPTYIGPLSRLHKTNVKQEYELMVLLSGPEPQRSILEDKLMTELAHFKGNILFIKGRVETKQTITTHQQFTIYNFMTSKALEKAINSSKIILCRSGYTTIMDLAKLEKKAFFIPTPGQFEQNYLAQRLQDLKIAPFCKQDDFKMQLLEELKNFKGLKMDTQSVDIQQLFSLF